MLLKENLGRTWISSAKKGTQLDLQQGAYMATNKPAGDGHRNGAVRKRSQLLNPQNDAWVKRNKETGQFIDQKTDGTKFKGVRRETNK